jgi:methylmalonyl-CoA mutase N-terminal domain/subunit
MALSRRRKVHVGVNEFVNEGEVLEIPLLEIDESVERDQVRDLSAVKARRDNGAVRDRLRDLEKTAAGPGNLIPVLLDCSRAYVTLGEISRTLVRVFGEYREQPFF